MRVYLEERFVLVKYGEHTFPRKKTTTHTHTDSSLIRNTGACVSRNTGHKIETTHFSSPSRAGRVGPYQADGVGWERQLPKVPRAR